MRNNPNITIVKRHTILVVSETAMEKNISFIKENGYIESVWGRRRQSIGERNKVSLEVKIFVLLIIL